MTFGEYLSGPLSRTGVRALLRIPFAGALACFFLLGGALAQTAGKPDPAEQTADKPTLSKEPTLYVVGYAHLDTEWRWEYPQVINEYLQRGIYGVDCSLSPYGRWRSRRRYVSHLRLFVRSR